MTSHRRAFDGTERRETTDDEAVYRKRGKMAARACVRKR